MIKHYLYSRKRQFAQGGRSFPSPSQGNHGSWGVSVNKDKGRGPQVRTEAQGNIYTSPNGNWRVDGQGHHEFGKGRKPDYGVGVQVQGRFRRETDGAIEEDVAEADEVEEGEGLRARRQTNGSRGQYSVNFDHQNGRGPHVRTDASYNAYTSPNGNWKVNTNGYHEAGKGMKPMYGGGVSVSNDPRGQIGVNVNRQPGGGAHVRTDANYNIHTSRNGNWHVDANGYHEAGRGMKPNYGGQVSVTGRFRRDVNGEVEEDGERVRRSASPNDPRGQIGVTVNRQPGGGAHVRTDGSYNVYRSPNRNWEVNANGFHEAGRGMKPNYGAGVSVIGRFRRNTPDGSENVPVEEVE